MNHRKSFDVGASIQGHLFDAGEQNASEPVERCTGRFREAINEAIRKCRRGDRFWIAAEMSRLLQIDITKTQIDSWTSESLDRHIPFELMPALCRVTGSARPLEVFAEICGYEVVGPQEQGVLEIARIEARIHDLELKREQLRPKTRRYLDEQVGRQ